METMKTRRDVLKALAALPVVAPALGVLALTPSPEARGGVAAADVKGPSRKLRSRVTLHGVDENWEPVVEVLEPWEGTVDPLTVEFEGQGNDTAEILLDGEGWGSPLTLADLRRAREAMNRHSPFAGGVWILDPWTGAPKLVKP